MKVLLIDDLRNELFVSMTYGVNVTRVARNYQEGVKALMEERWDILCLDHDLASYDESGQELTGYDIMRFIEKHPEFCPKDLVIVSANPVGRVNIQRAWDSIQRYLAE